MSSHATKMIPEPDEVQDEVLSNAEEPRPYEQRVAILAYRLWQDRGCPDGSPEVDWRQAEQELQETGK